MTEDEFDAYLEECSAELRDKQAYLQAAYGLGQMGRWALNQEAGILDFFDAADTHRLRFPVTPIGTWASVPETWKWAWANDRIEKGWREKAAVLKGLHAETDFDLFQEEKALEADEVMAWELVAVAIRYLGAQGCYRAPNRDVYLFLALGQPVALS